MYHNQDFVYCFTQYIIYIWENWGLPSAVQPSDNNLSLNAVLYYKGVYSIQHNQQRKC